MSRVSTPTTAFLLRLASIHAAALPANRTWSVRELGLRRQLLSQSTTYCYLDADDNLAKDMIGVGCGSGLPQGARACAVGTTVVCVLDDGLNGADANRWESTYAFDHCEDLTIYLKDDGSKLPFCNRLASTGSWATRRRDTAGNGRKESTGDSWWGCGWWWQHTDWHDGECRDSKRYLGESCWDDAGECDNVGVANYAGLHMSCATVPSLAVTTPTCIPSAFNIERNKCQCGWFDWYVGFACGASGGACNGHPCVYSTGSGDYSCDYQANNDW